MPDCPRAFQFEFASFGVGPQVVDPTSVFCRFGYVYT